MRKPIYILGINSVYHESSACILKDGILLAAVEEERFNRVKHAKPAKVDNPDLLPTASIDYCLSVAGIGFDAVDHVAYSFNPHRRKKSYWSDGYTQSGSWGTARGEEIFYQKLLSVPQKIKALSKDSFKGRFHWIDHHIAHAAGTFFVSPFSEALTIVIDGIGEDASAWIGYGQKNKLVKIKEISLPHSLGFLWEKFSEYLGFTDYDAGKVMGLSSYGDWKKYWKQFHQIVSFNENDIFRVDNEIMRFRVPDFSGLETLFGIKKRERDEKISPEHEHIAAGLQKISQKIVLRLIKYALTRHPSKNICLSGGVFLNCVANEETFLKLPIDDVFIPPSTHDGGNAIGAAFYVWNRILKKPRGFILESPYMGPEFSSKEIEAVLRSSGLKFEKDKNIEQHAAKLLAEGNIIAWFQGRMELGPRALGNRSILADPRKINAREILNMKVKHREYFRPLAPSVLEEKARDWFYIKKPLLSDRFMLFAVTPIYPEKIPAVTHIDETCRIQTVNKKTNPKYHKLIEEFGKLQAFP